MLAAAEVVGNSSYGDVYRKRLVFAAFAGEPWGYMGSKRFLWELHTRENSTLGLSLEQIEQVGSCTFIDLVAICHYLQMRVLHCMYR